MCVDVLFNNNLGEKKPIYQKSIIIKLNKLIIKIKRRIKAKFNI
jgi:hypothetical protein